MSTGLAPAEPAGDPGPPPSATGTSEPAGFSEPLVAGVDAEEVAAPVPFTAVVGAPPGVGGLAAGDEDDSFVVGTDPGPLVADVSVPDGVPSGSAPCPSPLPASDAQPPTIAAASSEAMRSDRARLRGTTNDAEGSHGVISMSFCTHMMKFVTPKRRWSYEMVATVVVAHLE